MPPFVFDDRARPCLLSPVPAETKSRILAMPPSREAHERASTLVPALREIECRDPSTAYAGAGLLRLAAWNLQHAHFPEASADLLARNRIDLALLTEVDIGVRRSGQRHTIADMAARMGGDFGYAVGVEFYELLATDGISGPPGGDSPNRIGFHGNGWITRLPAGRPAIIRLREEADWFVNPRRNQRRVGGRMAVAGTFPLGGGEFVAAAVHLESDTDQAGRRRQMEELLAALERYAEGRPVVIGGDFNAGARHPEFDPMTEGLFDAATTHGYEWRDANTRQPTSRRSLVTNAVQQDRARYDWFFVRGLTAADPGVAPAVDERGTPLSDHDAIVLTIRF